MKFKVVIVIFALLSTLIAINIVPSFAESNGSILLSVNYQNGDVVTPSGMSIIVYQDKISEPIINKTKILTLPHLISSLPKDHSYKVEVYQKSMYSGFGIVKLKNNQEDLNIIIQSNLGMRFFIYFNDGHSPLTEIPVRIKSHDGVLFKEILTDNAGQTPTVWAPTSANNEDFYYAEVVMSQEEIYKSETINALNPGKRDITVVTEWPEEITNLISLKVFKTANVPVNKNDGRFGIEIHDLKNNLIKELSINKRGVAHFSNLKVGEYLLSVMQFSSNNFTESEEIFSKKIFFTGLERTDDIILNNLTIPVSESKQIISAPFSKSLEFSDQKSEKLPDGLPEWFGLNINWHNKGIISDVEFTNAINYLIAKSESKNLTKINDNLAKDPTIKNLNSEEKPEIPIIYPPPNILTVTLNNKDELRYVSQIGVPIISDDSTPQNRLIITNDAPKPDESGIPFKIGTTKVTWTTTDSDGNVGIAYQNVTVIENPLETPTNQHNKRIMIDFDDGYASVYNYGKPILDKYNLKTTQYIICGIPTNVQTGYMSWGNIHELAAVGHDIQAHSMNHLDSNMLSESKLDTEYGDYVLGCFTRNNIFDIKTVALPFSHGSDNKTVTSTLMNTYDFGRGSVIHNVTSLHCENELSNQNNCATYSSEKNTEMNVFHRYNIPWWSHDLLIREGYNDQEIFSKFIKYVNQATKNTRNETLEIPIVVYHRIVLDNLNKNSASLGTTVTLFEAEMKYLRDNTFKIFTAKDFGYDEVNNWITLDPTPISPNNSNSPQLDQNTTSNDSENPMHNVFSSFGLSTYSKRQIQAEYVSDTSSLVGKKIVSITVNLKRVGLPADNLKVGIFNEDKSIKYLFGEIGTSDISEKYTDYTFSLPQPQTYNIDIGDRIGIKLTGGDSENFVAIMTDKTNFFDGENSHLVYHTDSWTELIDQDLHMILRSSVYETDLKVSAEISTTQSNLQQLFTLSSNKPATIFYTIDGSDPTVSSPVFTSPIAIYSTTTVKFFAKDRLDNLSTIVVKVFTIIPKLDDNSGFIPTTIHDTIQINPTKSNGREWYSDWNNGNVREITQSNQDPDDPMFILRGSNDSKLKVNGDGIATLSGNQPRMYVTDPNKELKWKNTEVTIYLQRISESTPDTSAGIVIGARSNHDLESDCGVDTYYSRMLYDGNANFEKELEHPIVSQPKPSQNKINWTEGEIPYNVWIGHKFVLRDYDDENHVRLQMYLDKTDGLNGGNWTMVADWQDDGTWNTPPNSCGFPENKIISDANSSIFVRNTEISSTLYKKFSVREIDPLP